MSTPKTFARTMARTGMRLAGAVIVGLLAVVVLVGIGVHAREPQLSPLPPPTPEDARYAQVFMQTMEAIGRRPDRTGDVSGTVEEFNGLFRILARSAPNLRLHADIEDGALVVRAALRLPAGWPAEWTNLSAVITPFDGPLRLEALRVGRLALPPGPSLRILSRALDHRFGDGVGSQALGLVSGLSVAGARLTFDIDMPPGGERLLSRNVVSELYGRDMVSRDQVAREVRFLQAEVAAGRLLREGSFTPWVRAVIDRAAGFGQDDSDDAVMAGFMALNFLCGSRHFTSTLLPPPVGEDDPMPEGGPDCGTTALHGRVDLRRHFTTAATIKLISNRAAAMTAGEAKELVDVLFGGFDFTDIAANNSGIRLAMRLDGAEGGDLEHLASRITGEEDLIISLDGIPGIMERGAFEARFGTLDSPEYQAMLGKIERRIDLLPIHADGAGRDG